MKPAALVRVAPALDREAWLLDADDSMEGSVIDRLLLGDPARRIAFGLAVLAVASAALAWLEWRVRRRSETYLDHQAVLAFGVACAPIGVAVMISGPWGPMGAAVFVAVAMVVCGVGAVVILIRRAT